MIHRDFKETQRRENYRRAEAFLMWKFGSRSHDAMDRDVVHCVGATMAALLVEFCEKVEEDLLARMRDYDKVCWDNLEAKAKFGPFAPFTTDSDFFKSPLMGYAGTERPPMRRHWKNDPGAYTTEELEKLKADEEGDNGTQSKPTV